MQTTPTTRDTCTRSSLHTAVLLCLSSLALADSLPTPETPWFNVSVDAPHVAAIPPGFATTTATYNQSRAERFAHFSNAAYCSSDSIDAWSCAPCQAADPTFKGKTVTSSEWSNQAFVGSNDGDIVIAFRGTSNLENWIGNLYYKHVATYPRCDGCLVHSGFYDMWSSLRDEVTSLVQAELAKQPDAFVFVTGHSLGAALAVLAAAELHFGHGVEIQAVYTYGLPRVGNKAFHDFYTQGPHISWRLTHDRDPVPHLPLMSMGFYHVTTEVYYPSDPSSGYTVCDNSGEDSKCSNHNLVDLNVSDHLHYLGIAISAC